MSTGYCLKCKTNRTIENAHETSNNGRLRLLGNCNVCERKISKFISSGQPRVKKSYKKEGPRKPRKKYEAKYDDQGNKIKRKYTRKPKASSDIMKLI